MEKVRIDKAKNSVLVRFNEDIYDKEAIAKASEDYNEACDIKRCKEGILLSPREDIDINTLGYEFYNYVLGIMKN